MSFLKKGKVATAIPSFSTEDIVPAGVGYPFFGPIPPTGYLLCDGSAISRTTYARLFASIGTTYGSGDGSTTFNLPDSRGVFLRGTGSQTVNGRSKGGNSLGQITEDSMQDHAHESPSRLNSPPFGDGSGTVNGLGIYASTGSSVANLTDGAEHQHNSNGTPRRGSETYPVNMAVNYIIKF